MAKMFFSLGFWMTIVLFIALGYASGYVLDESGVGSTYGVITSALRHEFHGTANELGSSDVAGRNKCASQTTSRDDDLFFRQSANLQASDRTYAPGLSFSVTRHPDRIRVCPGPIEIPPLY
jgi:hypothetical protein